MQTRRIPADLAEYQAGYRAGKREALRELIDVVRGEHKAATDGVLEQMPGAPNAEAAWADVLNRLVREAERLTQ